MQKINSKKIIEIFNKKNIEGFINIFFKDKKTLSYSPLYDEISVDNSNSVSTNITIIKNNQKATYSIDGFSETEIEKSINELLKMIELGETDKDIILPQINDTIEKDFRNQDIENLTIENLKKEFEKIQKYNFDKHIKIEDFSIGKGGFLQCYINSNGAIKKQYDNYSFYYLDLIGEKNKLKDNDYIYKTLKKKPEINLGNIQKLEKTILNKISSNETKFKSGNYDIVLDKDVVIDFLSIILQNLGAEAIREGLSMFSKHNIGDKIFSDSFSIVNTPFLEGYTGNIAFDKEGITTKKTTIFENGILKSKFYNYKNALKEGLENLGNSNIYNIELKTDYTVENICKDNSFLFTNLMALHTVDAITGKYSLNGEGYILKNGEKTDFIKNLSLSGNIIDLFSNIKEIGSDFKTDGNFKVPSISFYNQKIV